MGSTSELSDLIQDMVSQLSGSSAMIPPGEVVWFMAEAGGIYQSSDPAVVSIRKRVERLKSGESIDPQRVTEITEVLCSRWTGLALAFPGH